MNKIFILFIFLLFSSISQFSFAQDRPILRDSIAVRDTAAMKRFPKDSSAVGVAGGFGKIQGVVMDSTSQEPVEFAVVALIDEKTNKPVDGTMCDDHGKFSINKIKPGQYKLSITFFDYRELVINGLTISEDKRTIELGKLNMRPEAKQLNEITVEGQKQLVEEKVDRIVYNAENDANNKGGDATDVLRKVPLLTVDLDGNVSLRGSQNIKVLINNKPSTITAGSIADALKQIPSDQIKSVEVITSPSSRYDAEGSSGIINIITKKNNLEGFSLGVDGSAGVRGSSLGVNGSYRKGKMGFTLGGNGRAAYNVTGSFDNRQTTTNNGIQTLNVQTADTRNQRLFGNYTLGWDYDINKNNALSSSVKYSFRNGNSYQDGLLTQNYINNILLSQNKRNVDVSDLSGTVDVSVNYLHLFKQPQHEFSLLGLYSRNNRTNNFTNSILDTSDMSTVASRLKNNNTSYNQEITFQADYQRPLSKTQLIEVGAKNINREVSSDYKYYSAAGANGEYVQTSSTTQNNSLNYNQNVTAGYLSYTLNFLKSYTLKAGGRYEYTYITAKQSDNTPVNIPSYGILVPSINMSRKLKNGNMIKASYTRRIQRPSIQYLNPNIQASNPLNITIGNPALRPEYSNNYELSYTTYVKSSMFTFMGFARTTNRAIESVRDVLGDTIRTTYQNIGSEDSYGLNFFTNISLSNKFTLNGGIDAYYAVLKNNVPNPLYNASNHGIVAGYRLMGTYTLTKTLALQAFGFYRGRQVNLQGYQGGFGIYSLSLKKDFADKRGSFGFGAENFFTPNFHIHNTLSSPVLDQKTTTVLHMMNFKVNFSYRIGKMSTEEKQRKKKKSISNDDMKEDNDSGIGNTPQNSSPGRK
ncbi:MAG TPA: TonB-dependent receptor [Cytophagaceae bacterium]|nr:TonB-dependent receptor [Cytophagaceae bacterium]